MDITIFVPGVPAAKGSMKAFNNRVMHNSPEKLYLWQNQIAFYARKAIGTRTPTHQPVKISCLFVFKKPQKPKHNTLHIVKPDGDKLLRTVFDALTGITHHDDCIVAEGWFKKIYENKDYQQGAYIKVELSDGLV